MSALSSYEGVQRKQILFGLQLLSIGVLAVAAIGVSIINHFFPTFFPYHYFYWSGWSAVWRFWPLFAAGLLLNIVGFAIQGGEGWVTPKERNGLYVWGLVTSVLAGLWEELAFRWAFICYAMISIAFGNWIFSSFLGWILVVVLGFATLWALATREYLFAVIAAALTAVFLWFALCANPIYWFYSIFGWVVHYTAFYQMDPVLYGPYPPLFIYGMLLANVWFRDGHKYQGVVGIVNSWYAGLVLVYAMVTYGLITAIVIHAIYDIAIETLAYSYRMANAYRLGN